MISNKVRKKHKMIEIGDKFESNSGTFCTVVDYKNSKKVAVVFDGEDCIQHFRASHLRDGMFKSKNSYTVTQGTTYKTKGGDCVVVEYYNNRNILVEFQDDFKYRVIAAKSTLEKGLVKNPYHKSLYGHGYLGECGAELTEGSEVLEIYKLWKSLVQRCYDECFKKAHETYRNCTLQKEWTCFANFYSWCKKQKFSNVGYDLDKDLIVSGNKHYSEHNCLFLPRELNANISNSRSSNTTGFIGVSYENKSGKYYASYRVNGRTISLGKYKTPEEASAAYVEAKEAYIKSLAEKWKGKIEDRAYQALLLWTVYPKES